MPKNLCVQVHTHSFPKDVSSSKHKVQRESRVQNSQTQILILVLAAK